MKMLAYHPSIPIDILRTKDNHISSITHEHHHHDAQVGFLRLLKTGSSWCSVPIDWAPFKHILPRSEYNTVIPMNLVSARSFSKLDSQVLVPISYPRQNEWENTHKGFRVMTKVRYSPPTWRKSKLVIAEEKPSLWQCVCAHNFLPYLEFPSVAYD